MSLIKKYSESDDYGEYSKKEELWKRISSSKEIKEFTVQATPRRLLINMVSVKLN